MDIGCPGKVPGRDGTGQDLETLKVPWSCGPGTKEVQKSQDFFWRSRDSPAPFPGQDFANKGSNHLPKSWNSYEVENLPDAIIDGVHVAAISNLDKKH